MSRFFWGSLLVKGAVGQATENMNIMFGLDEKARLRLKPSVF